jgi:hypothetical protein
MRPQQVHEAQFKAPPDDSTMVIGLAARCSCSYMRRFAALYPRATESIRRPSGMCTRQPNISNLNVEVNEEKS